MEKKGPDGLRFRQTIKYNYRTMHDLSVDFFSGPPRIKIRIGNDNMELFSDREGKSDQYVARGNWFNW